MEMGPSAESMNNEEIRETFAHAETGVFWDVEDFPVKDIDSFVSNIKSALGKAGFHGKVSITAYGDDEKQDSSIYKDAGINFLSRGSKRARNHRMFLDIHIWVLDHRSFYTPANLMVITKNFMEVDDVEDTQFDYYLDCLYVTNYNVLLAVPDDYQVEKLLLFFRLNSVWLWSRLCAGEKPLDDVVICRKPPQEIERVCPTCGK